MKQPLKISLIVLGSILGLILLINVGFTLWLKYQLPNYIKNKTPYAITYKSLNVEILSGSISAENILIKTKNPNDKEKLAIDGFVSGLNVSRLGIIDLIKNKKINTNTVKLTNPNLKIVLPKPKVADSVKEKMPFLIRNIDIIKGQFEVIKPDNSKVFSAQNLNLEIKNLSLNDHPNELPFAMHSYKITTDNLFARISDVYTINSNAVKTKDGQLEINDFELKSILDFKDWEKRFTKQKSLFNIKSKKVSFIDLVFDKAKLNLKNAQFVDPEFIIQSRNEKIIKPKNTRKKGIDLNFANVDIKNGKVSMLKSNGEKSLSLAKFDANVKEFLMDEETSKNKLPFKFEDYKIAGNTFFYDSGKYYNMTLSSFNIGSQSIDLMNFKLIPKMSRAEFVKTIPMEDDLFDIFANRIQLSGVDWTFEQELYLHLKSAKLTQVDANIFRSKIPKDNPKEKLLYSKLLRTIKFPLIVDNLQLVNSKLVYEEDKPDSNGPGKVFFTNFNMNVKNLNSNKNKGANTKVPIVINCQFMGVSPMKVNWNFDTANLRDQFTIAGYIRNLPANDINPFIKPYMNITATGTFTGINFDFKGNNDVMSGKFKISHKNLKVSVLDKNTKEKKKFQSAVANLVVKKDSKTFPESVDIDVKRSKDRSFFNFYWKGIEDGLKKSLLVIKI